MAARQERIEPTFGGADRESSDIFVSAEDRAVPISAAGRGKAAGSGRRARAPSEAQRPRKRARRSIFGGRGGGGNGGSSGGPRRRRGFFGHVFRTFLSLGLVGAVGVVALVGYFAVRLPQESWAIPDRPPNVKIMAIGGELLANRGLTGGKQVSLDEISPYVPEAVIAIEDRRFYEHMGVDPLGIARAFLTNLQAGQTVQGGSTLTQQLAKNIFLSPEQSIERKIQEAILAVWLETRFTKAQILEMYLNRVYFGSGATGVEAAAERYFAKSASELTLAESALLAGLLKAPSRLSPARDPEAAKERADVVLAAMREENFIDEEEFRNATAQEAQRARSYWTGAEHYAADLVMKDIKSLVGEVEEDVVVETTIDLELERLGERVIRETVDGASQNVSQGALVALDGTGAIRALVGGKDYAASQFNRAVDARRQPGSTFKPFVYAAAIEAGYRPETMMDDSPVRIGNWSPENYDRRFRGPVTVADALRQSLNTIAARLTAAVGPQTVIDLAERLGINSDLVDNASIALGTSEVSLLELTGAFAPFANGGYRATPHLVNRVTTEDGRVLWERGAEVPPHVISAETTGMMNAMLRQVVESGTGRRAAIEGWQVAGKTGTTQDFKDAWFVGYTANLVTGVWLGNDNGAKMQKVTGGSLPADAWHEFMVAAHSDLPASPLPGQYQLGAGEPLTAQSGYTDGGFYEEGYGTSQDGYAYTPQPDGYGYDSGGQGQAPSDYEDPYYRRAGEAPPMPRADVPGGGGFYDSAPPPGVTVEGPVDTNRSLFRSIFGN